MRTSYRTFRWLLTAALAVVSLSALVRAQARAEITINDTGVMPENLTSSQDGSVYFASVAKGTIYRAAPGAAQAEPWILASASGLANTYGLLADDKTNTLWVCQNSGGGRGGPVVGQTALRSFDLKTGAAKGTFPFPTNGGVCNDMAVATDGTVYATESFANRVLRLKPGATAPDVWITDAQQLAGVDGVAILADGAVYVNTFFAGRLFRIPVNTDGSAGTLVPIEMSMPASRPDGLRSVGAQTLIQAEGQGRVTELTITGNRADVRVLSEATRGATGVTLVGDTVFALVERVRAVAVPYRGK